MLLNETIYRQFFVYLVTVKKATPIFNEGS